LLTFVQQGDGHLPDFEELWGAAAEADARRTKHFDDWLAIARGLASMRQHLLERSGANTDASPRYRREYERWIITGEWAAKWAGPGKKPFRSACYWLVENLDAVQGYRGSLSEGDRLRS
jgi:hypothetical protein